MKVSVIMPVFNGGRYLLKYSIPSLLRQTYKDWEAIIVDDGSNDNSEEIARDLCRRNERFRYYQFEKNRGIGAVLNFGVNKSRGEIIAFLEQDDIWLPDKLQIQVDKFNQGCQYVNCYGLISNYNSYKDLSLLGIKWNFSTLALSKNLISRIPLFPEDKNIVGVEDSWLNIYLSVAKESGQFSEDIFCYLDQPLVVITYHTDSLSKQINFQNIINRYQALIKFFKPYADYQEISWWLSHWSRHIIYNRIMQMIPRLISIPLIMLYRTFSYYKQYTQSEFFKNVQKKYSSRIEEARRIIGLIGKI